MFTAGALTLTVANPGLLGAPVGAAPWLVDLSGPAGRVVAVTADGADLVLTVDGVSARRLAAAVPSLVITGSAGNDVLRLDAVLAIPVTFAGGAGRDAVRGPAANSLWTITGAGVGTVGTVAFSGVEDLLGVAGNEDVFAVTATGSLAGVVAGGAGGWDTMRFDGGTGGIAYLPSSPDAGRVIVGGRTFDFVGLEPVSKNGEGTPDVTLTYGTEDDEFVLTVLANGNITVQATGAEDIDFVAPTASLTINAGKGKLTIQGVVNLGGATLTVNNAKTITVTGTLTAATIVLNATERATIRRARSSRPPATSRSRSAPSWPGAGWPAPPSSRPTTRPVSSRCRPPRCGPPTSPCGSTPR